MFKRISIILIVLFALLCFIGSANATLYTVKDADNTYVQWQDEEDNVIFKIDDDDGVTLPGGISAGGDFTVTDPTSGDNAVYGLVNAGVAWTTSDNVVGIRGKAVVTAAGSTGSATGVWAGLEITSASVQRFGLQVGMNVEAYSSTACLPNAVLYIQSLPYGANSDFSAVPYLVFSETVTSGAGSHILFEVGHMWANTIPDIGEDELFWHDTLQIAVNEQAGVRTPFFIPLSTDSGTFTFEYPVALSGTMATGIAMTGTYTTAGISISTTYAAADDYAILVDTDSTASTGTVRSVFITQGVGAANAIHEALYVALNSEFATGSWANAIVGRIDYGTTGSASGGMAAVVCAELNMPGQAVPGGVYAAFDAEIEIPNNCVLIDDTKFPVSFFRAGLWGTDKSEFDDHGYLLHIDGITAGDGDLWYGNTLKIVVGATLAAAGEWFIPLSSAQASYTTAYPIASTSTTGFLSTATFDADATRTNYALAIGTTANALDVSLITAVDKNLNPMQMNINVIGNAPTSSTINLIHSLITHTTTEMPALRLKCADWNIVFDKNVKDVFVIQTEMTITGDSTIAGDAFAASFYANVGTGTISAKKFGGLFVVVSGSAGVTSDQSRYSVARFLAAGGSSVDSILELKTDATSTATKGIYIYSQGTIVTGIDIGDCTTGINVAANTVMPQLLTIGTSTNPLHWAGAVSNILVYQENLDTTPGSVTANKFSLSAAQSAATTSGRLECFRAETTGYLTNAITADMRALVGQISFPGIITYTAGGIYDFNGAYGVIASIWSGAALTATGNMYPLGIFFGLEAGSSIGGESAYIYIYNFGCVPCESIIRLFNNSATDTTNLLSVTHPLGSKSGPCFTGDVVPHETPTSSVLGADGHITIDVNGTPYYIPIFDTLEGA